MTPTPPLGGDYCLFLRNVTLELAIGILPEERQGRQRVIINVEMYVSDPGRFASDNIADYVSYADVFEDIKGLASENVHIELVENLAETIAQLALKQERVCRVVVSVEKPDVIADAQGVGIVIERCR